MITCHGRDALNLRVHRIHCLSPCPSINLLLLRTVLLTCYWVLKISSLWPSRKTQTGAKMDPETQVHDAARLSFLCLPAEVRNMIYRLLLVAEKPLGSTENENLPAELKGRGPVWANAGEYHLQPAILSVCSQIYREASSILNGENTFAIYISGYDDEFDDEQYDYGGENSGRATTKLMNFQYDVALGVFQNCNAPFSKFERFELLVERADLLEVRCHIERLCLSISRRASALKHLCLHLLLDTDDTRHKFHTSYWALGPFAMLRNLRSVAFRGVLLPFAERLTSLMLGNTPPENLELMYRLLEDCVRDLQGSRLELRRAFNAMHEWDVQKFKETRSKILLNGQGSINYALVCTYVFYHDAKCEDDHQTKIGRGYHCKIVGHDSKAEDDSVAKIEQDH